MSSSRSSPIIAKLEADLLLAPEQRADIVDNFWKNNKFPLVEPIADDENNIKYTFILQRDAVAVATQDRYLISDHRFGSPVKVTDDELLNNVNGTDINYVTMILPADARFRYGFVEFPKNAIKNIFTRGDAEYSTLQSTADKFMFYGEPVSKIVEENRFSDPRNDRMPTGETDARHSLLVGPKAPKPINESGAQLDPARLQEYVLDDKKYWIYLPIDHDPARAAPYPLNIFLDGKQYIDEIHAPVILDSLTNAKKIPPGIAVFLAAPEDEDGSLRYQTYHTNDEFTHFVAEEFIPALQKRPELNAAPTCTLTGFSLSGLAATYIGLKHPELVSNVVSQSGAFWTDSAGSSLILRKEMPADLQNLESSAKTAFVLVDDALFFVDKSKNTVTPIPVTSQQMESLKKDLEIMPLGDKAAVIKFKVMPLHIMQRFEALTPTPLAPPYKMMEAIESFAAKKGATQFKLQAGLFEDSVSTRDGVTTNNNDLDSLLTCNKALNNILQSHGIKSDFSAASHAHTSDGCEATLAKPLERVLRRQLNVSLSSTAAIHQLANLPIAPVQAMQTPAAVMVKTEVIIPTTVNKAPAPKAEEKDIPDASPKPRPGK
jgi:enterochelin esterase-like enzyme